MPKLPRDLTQDEVVRALVRAGGVEVKGAGKGSHRAVEMPNSHTAIVPRKMKPGLLIKTPASRSTSFCDTYRQMEKKRTYTVLVHEEEDREVGGYWAEVVELPGCFASGDSLDELEQDVRGAIETYIDAQVKLGKPIPEGTAEIEPGERRWEIAVA